MSPELGRDLLILAAFIVLGWFAVGTQLNIRRGNRLLRWLGQGLPIVGERTTLRWLGSSAIELRVETALEPLRSAEVFVVLEPRDLPVFWWLFRARGRRDLLIVRAELRAAPRVELEAFRPGAWSARGRARALGREHWTPAPPPASPRYRVRLATRRLRTPTGGCHGRPAAARPGCGGFLGAGRGAPDRAPRRSALGATGTGTARCASRARNPPPTRGAVVGRPAPVPQSVPAAGAGRSGAARIRCHATHAS